MKILITGITGNVGNACFKALEKENVEIVGAVRNVKKYDTQFTCELRALDFENKETFKPCLEGITHLFLVRPPQISDPHLLNEFIDTAIKCGVKHVVFLSLMGIEKNPFPPHKKIEEHLMKSNCTYTFLRPSFFMQNLLEAHLEDIKERMELFIPSGKARLSFIDTEDIGEVAAKCLIDEAHLNKAYTLTGPSSLNYYEVADILSEVLNIPIQYTKPSLLNFRKVMLTRGLKKDYVNVMLFLNIMTRLGTAKKVTQDVSTLLGREAHSLKEFIEKNKEKFI